MSGCSGAGWFVAVRRSALLAPAIALGLLLAGCDDGTQTAPATGSATPVAAATSPPAQPASIQATVPMQSETADAAPAGTTLQNDPSAPTNTALCGLASQENNAISRQLLSRQYAEAGQCSAYACYDAATATYLGADGYRHVCR